MNLLKKTKSNIINGEMSILPNANILTIVLHDESELNIGITNHTLKSQIIKLVKEYNINNQIEETPIRYNKRYVDNFMKRECWNNSISKKRHRKKSW